MYNRTLIIPSAGLSTRLFPLSYNTPKVLIKLNGVPIFHLLYKKAREVGIDNIVIAVAPEFERQVQEFINEVYANAEIPIYVQVVDKPQEGVLYSVYQATSHPEVKENILIILSDTLYTAKLPVDEGYHFVVTEKVTGDKSRWCLAQIESGNEITKFIDKPLEPCEAEDALIGIYYLDTFRFNMSSILILNSGEKVRGEYQLSQVLNEDIKSSDIKNVTTVSGAWHDTGTLLTLQKASEDYFLAREFNNISINNGNLIKTSTNITSLRNQYIWYTTLPHKFLAPTIYDYQEHGKTSSLIMELCPLNDLGSIFNFCKAEPVFFQQAMEYILTCLDDYLWLYGRPVDISWKPNKEMLVKKVISRIESVSWIDSEKFFSLFGELEHLSFRDGLYCHIHGDLILSNILFDPQRMVIKLIDPRGDYGGAGVVGDLRYDLAKLLHSVDGCYESIIHNLYQIKDNQVVFFMNDAKKKCFKVAQEAIFKYARNRGITKRELQVIEASLFLSMIPLHADDEKRQQAFYLTALRIMEDLNANLL